MAKVMESNKMTYTPLTHRDEEVQDIMKKACDLAGIKWDQSTGMTIDIPLHGVATVTTTNHCGRREADD